MATSGIAAGARPVLNQLVKEAAENNYNCVITQTGDIGLNSYEPIVQVFDKDNNQVTYVHVLFVIGTSGSSKNTRRYFSWFRR